MCTSTGVTLKEGDLMMAFSVFRRWYDDENIESIKLFPIQEKTSTGTVDKALELEGTSSSFKEFSLFHLSDEGEDLKVNLDEMT